MPVLALTPTEQPPESLTHAKAVLPSSLSPAIPPPMENNNTTRGDFPLVQLQGDSIPDTIAASLASSLLGHVLFLKNQVPLPIPQLTRLKPTSAKSAKLKEQLLDAYDTLTSHLDTTFTALSTAFAKGRDKGKGNGNSLAYLAIVLGPSVGTAKARVLLAVDGLETKVWGERDDLPEDDDEEDSDDEEEDDEDQDSDDDEEDEHPPDSDSDSDSESEPQPTATHADHQLALRTADRLLSRALVGADADLAADMHPTQTHVLIRAPRRFVHPAWVPRQSVSASLDRTFLERGKGKSKVEGVWVACRRPAVNEEEDGDMEEDDEMIWWSWDGKIVGFAGW
ncbi:hypothetical protein CPB85DRAFT_1552214 [Mucidula mucida]|nr:hypothetical protein CPB85DRAFT_1552214 [Mucidula mucida]